MFAAASGARLAHRHNKATIKKQLCSNNVEALQANYKAFQRHQHILYSDTPGIHGTRYAGRHPRGHNYSSKLYSSDSESVVKLSSSYIDLHGRIPKFGHVDFEGKAAWQDRELGFGVGRRESMCVTAEGAAHRFKQKEAHKRWVKRNRIHDSTFGDCSSEDEELYGAYGVQSTAANALLYIGLGTMCIGMIIAFVGTGEKGFKTIELRLIGPSLIGAGVMIIILRVMLCVCPSKCFKFRKHKHKNSTNKLNSEDECEDNAWKDAIECVKEAEVPPKQVAAATESLLMADRTSTMKKSESKKRVSIVEMPTTSAVGEGGTRKPPSAEGAAATKEGEGLPHLVTVQERRSGSGKVTTPVSPEPGSPRNLEKAFDAASISSDLSLPSCHVKSSWTEGELSQMKRRDSLDHSDLSLSSLANGFLNSDSFDSELSSKTVKNASKFETQRSPKNVKSEILLDPSNLNELQESD